MSNKKINITTAKDMRRALNNKKSEITYEELANSSYFHRFATLSVNSIFDSFGIRPIPVDIRYLLGDNTTAYTNNISCFVNSANPLLSEGGTLKNKFRRVLGIIYHEIGHVLFSDVTLRNGVLNGISAGTIQRPKGLSKSDKKSFEEIRFMIETPAYGKILAAYHAQISNSVEDGRIEQLLLTKGSRFNGFCVGLKALRKVHYDTIMDNPNPLDFSEVPCLFNAILSYAKFNTIQGYVPKSNKLIEELLPIIDRMLNTVVANDFYNDVTLIIIKLWPTIKDAIINQKEMDEAFAKLFEDLLKQMQQSQEEGDESESGDSGSNSESQGGKGKGEGEENEEEGGDSGKGQGEGQGKEGEEGEEEEEGGSKSSKSQKSKGKNSKSKESDKDSKDGEDEKDSKGKPSDSEESSDTSSDDSDISNSGDSLDSDPNNTAPSREANTSENGTSESSTEEGKGVPDTKNLKAKGGSLESDLRKAASEIDSRTINDIIKQLTRDLISLSATPENTTSKKVKLDGSEIKSSDNNSNMSEKEESSKDFSLNKVLSEMAEEIVENEIMEEMHRNLESQSGNLPSTNDTINVRKEEIRPNAVAMLKNINLITLPVAQKAARQINQHLKTDQRTRRSTRKFSGKKFHAEKVVKRDFRYFENKDTQKDIPSLAIGVRVDESGSMMGERAEIARIAAICMYQLAQQVDNINIAIYGDTADYDGYDVTLMPYVDFDVKTKDDEKRLTNICARSMNKDVTAVKFVAERLLKQPEEMKLLIVISDGCPNARGCSGYAANMDLKKTVNEYSKKGIKVIAAAIGSDKEQIKEIYGEERFLDISDLSKLPVKLVQIIKRQL